MTRRRPFNAYARAALALLGALLLLAQQLGLSHAVWHAAQQLPQQVSAPDKTAGDAPVVPHASKLCGLDAALSQVLGGAAGASFAVDLLENTAHVFTGASQSIPSVRALAARSRGPPALL